MFHHHTCVLLAENAAKEDAPKRRRTVPLLACSRAARLVPALQLAGSLYREPAVPTSSLRGLVAEVFPPFVFLGSIPVPLNWPLVCPPPPACAPAGGTPRASTARSHRLAGGWLGPRNDSESNFSNEQSGR